MLLSIILGDQKTGVTNDWSLTTDSFDNTFISNESIRQRIRLGKKVEKKLETAFSSSNMKGFHIAEKIFFSNNNKNMNLSLMNFWSKDKEEMNKHKDEHILYITFLNKNYKMIKYDTKGLDVIQTYRKKDEYQGLAVVIKELGEEVFIMYAKDLLMNRFVKISITVAEDGKLTTSKSVIENKDEISNLKESLKKLGKRNNHFLISLQGIPTSTFIIDSKYKEEIESFAKEVPYANIIVLEAGSNSFDENRSEEEKEALDNMFKESLVDNRVRAITTVGVKIPYNFFRQYNILYVFNYDIKNNTISCLKSN